MAKRIVAIVLACILVVAIVLAVIPATRNAIGAWFAGISSSESDPSDGDTNTTVKGTIADLPEEERIAAIQKKLEEIEARQGDDRVYTPEEAFMMTMHMVMTEDGKILESGHNMAAPGVETYAMDTYPGGWKWAESNEDAVKVLMFLSGHKLSVAQTNVATNAKYVPADNAPLDFAVCHHGDGVLSGYFVRTQGDLTAVNFEAEAFSALKSVFRWWYESDANGNQVVKVGFSYCNDAPEGVTGVIPILLPSLSK